MLDIEEHPQSSLMVAGRRPRRPLCKGLILTTLCILIMTLLTVTWYSSGTSSEVLPPPPQPPSPPSYPPYFFSGSPDERCRVNVLYMEDLWIMELPVLYNATPARTIGWETYLKLVYGELDISDYPVDLRCFTFWWKYHIPKHVIQLFNDNYADTPTGKIGEVVDIGLKKIAWQIVLYNDQPSFVPSKNPPLIVEGLPDLWPNIQRFIVPPVMNHQYIEIFHDFNDWSRAWPRYSQVGWWAHHAPGSGIFAPSGATIISGADGYMDACKVLDPKNPDCRVCCTPAHVALRTAALKHNLSSLQSCCGQRGGHALPLWNEIAFFTAACDDCKNDAGACPNGIVLKTGRRAQHSCACDSSREVVNCGDRKFFEIF